MVQMSRLGLDKRLCAKALGTLLGQGTWTLYSIYSDNYYSNHLPAWLLGFLKAKPLAVSCLNIG